MWKILLSNFCHLLSIGLRALTVMKEGADFLDLLIPVYRMCYKPVQELENVLVINGLNLR